jgi:Secretion system C-terminal sorting domain
MKLGDSIMKNIPYLLLIFLFISAGNDLFAQNYKISGAGTAGVDGIYVENGTHGDASRPRYDHIDGIFFIYHDLLTFAGQSFWNIDSDFDDEADVIYYWEQPEPPTIHLTMPEGAQWVNIGVSGTLPNPTSMRFTTSDITFSDGSAFTPPNGTPGTNDNPIGRFQLTGSAEGGVLQAVTVDFAGTRSNVTNVKLWSSTDNTFNSGSDKLLGTKPDGSSATFDGFNSLVDNISGPYYFVTVDLAPGSTGDITATISSEASFTFAGANAPASFNAAPLSTGAVPLPVELTAFSVNVIDNAAILNWETATEVNNYGFEILRSAQNDNHFDEGTDKESWEKIGFVNGHGNSNSPKIYKFEDQATSSSGKYKYRLKQIDIDGKYEYSQIVEVEVDIPTEFELAQNYPNPFNPTTTIAFSIPVKGNVTVQVFNMLGEVIESLVNQELEPGRYNYDFDASALSSGTYIYRISAGTNVEVRKMILLK